MSTTAEAAGEDVAPGATSANSRLWRIVGAAVIAAALAALALVLFRFLDAANMAVRYPFELDYGEGIVWQQMRLIFAGRGYAPIDGFPAIVFHYPPLYHFIVHGIVTVSGMDPLAAGRLVSAASSVLAGLFLALIAVQLTRPAYGAAVAWTCGAFGALTGLAFQPVVIWAALMRVDMVAIAFSLGGILFAIRAMRRPASIHIAAFCFVAAVFTKQTAIAAPTAAFLVLLLVRPRTAFAGMATCIGVGGAALAALVIATHGGFLRHILLYNVNRFEVARLYFLVPGVLVHALFCSAAAFGVFQSVRGVWLRCRGARSPAGIRERLEDAPDEAGALLLLTYFLILTLMLVLMGKSGSNVNYMLEWMMAAGLFAGLAVRDATAAVLDLPVRGTAGRTALPAILLWPAALGLQAATTPPPPTHARTSDPLKIRGTQELSDAIRRAPRPVIADDMVLLLRSGKDVLWEPAIFAELASTGAWDQRPLIAQIKARRFAFFVTDGGRGEPMFDSRYTPAVADAMDAAYPRQRRLAGYYLHYPPAAAKP